MTPSRFNTKKTVLGLGLAAAIFTSCGSQAPPSATQDVDLGQLSEMSAEALSDGTVTRAEIEAARQRTVECLTSDGFAAEFLPQDDRVSLLSVDSGPPAAGEDDADFEQRFDTTVEGCKTQHLNAVDSAWLRETAPSEEEQRQALSAMQDCVEPFNISVPSADPSSMTALFERLDNPATPQAELDTLDECFRVFALATATAG